MARKRTSEELEERVKELEQRILEFRHIDPMLGES